MMNFIFANKNLPTAKYLSSVWTSNGWREYCGDVIGYTMAAGLTNDNDIRFALETEYENTSSLAHKFARDKLIIWACYADANIIELAHWSLWIVPSFGLKIEGIDMKPQQLSIEEAIIEMHRMVAVFNIHDC
jgi:hypothetical protein